MRIKPVVLGASGAPIESPKIDKKEKRKGKKIQNEVKSKTERGKERVIMLRKERVIMLRF